MALSAIVVTYRTGQVLYGCVSALLASPKTREIVLVDNGNAPEFESFLDDWAEREPRLIVVRGHGNVGFAAGCNLGAALARGERLLFVNPDAVLSPDAPERVADALDQSPGLTLVGGDLRCAAGLPERAARRERVTLWRAFVSFSGLSKFGRAAPQFRDVCVTAAMPEAAVQVSAVSGALFAMRRSDFEMIGGMDEGYFLHVEDVDLCRRVEDAGGSVLFLPGPHGVHHRSSSEASAKLIAQHKARSFARYFRKFSRSPWERAGAEIAALVLAVVAPLRVRA
jgi:GT2 family glycosyltransferase